MDELKEFEARKRDHIQLAMEDRNQATGLSGLDRVRLLHEALPDLDLADVSIQTRSLQQNLRTPFYVSSMTAGHENGVELNIRLAKACEKKGWPMGVGSQRRQLFDSAAREEWQKIRFAAPETQFWGNIGIAQLITSSVDKVRELYESLDAVAMIIHLNALQECMQPEGTPQFKGGYQAIERLVKELKVPVIVKETGCGMSLTTMKRLVECGVSALDVSGLGGTHWGRIEGRRSSVNDKLSRVADTFKDWGISTARSVSLAQKIDRPVEVWASGGVRTGLDAAKLVSLGAQMVGFAKPALENAIKGEESLIHWMEQIEYELRVAMFCTGSSSLESLKGKHYVE